MLGKHQSKLNLRPGNCLTDGRGQIFERRIDISKGLSEIDGRILSSLRRNLSAPSIQKQYIQSTLHLFAQVPK